MRASVGRARAVSADDVAAFAQLRCPMSRSSSTFHDGNMVSKNQWASGVDLGWRLGSPGHWLTRQAPAFINLSRPPRHVRRVHKLDVGRMLKALDRAALRRGRFGCAAVRQPGQRCRPGPRDLHTRAIKRGRMMIALL